MSKRSDSTEMSSILPRKAARRLSAFLEAKISLRNLDRLNHFRVQTRLLFSRFILLLVAALFFFFSWMTIAKEINDEREMFYFLMMMNCTLAIVLHMGIWESEREQKTFELLIMRVPGVHRLIWFKLSVSLVWTLGLSLPFFAGCVWFISLPWDKAAVYFLFCSMNVLCASLLTCIVGSFVHRLLPTAIIVVVLVWFLAVLTEEGKLPYKDYYRPFLYPYRTDRQFQTLTDFKLVRLAAVNRLVIAGMAGGLYLWFSRRLRKTEKWVR